MFDIGELGHEKPSNHWLAPRVGVLYREVAEENLSR
jgi:hypothetical protein